jgi:hypothetical protein
VVKNARSRRSVGTNTAVPTRAAHPNQVWSDELVHDESTDGRRRQGLTGLDESTREGLTIDCPRPITAGDVARVLQRLFAQRGAPGM